MSSTPRSNTTPTTTHLNLKLAGESHIPYREVKITIPARGIDQVYVYPPLMKTEKAGDTWVITGSLAANEILAVEMLGPSEGFSRFPGFRNSVDDVRGKTASAAFWYNLPYYAAYLLNILGTIAVILVPLLLIVIYRRYGHGEGVYRTCLPEHHSPARTSNPGRSTCSSRAMPWISMRTVIMQPCWTSTGAKTSPSRKKERGKGVIVKILSNANLDPYEQRVLMFLQLVSDDGVLDTDSIKALAKRPG